MFTLQPGGWCRYPTDAEILQGLNRRQHQTTGISHQIAKWGLSGWRAEEKAPTGAQKMYIKVFNASVLQPPRIGNYLNIPNDRYFFYKNRK